MRFRYLLIAVSIFSAGSWLGCGSSDVKGPLIDVDLNVRNLCNYGVATKTETRCDILVQDQCNDGYCWPEPSGNYQEGFCRQCVDHTDCLTGYGCDHRWCHKICTQTSECGVGEYCTKDYCRKPHTQGTQFSFINDGDRNLTINLNQTKLIGDSSACAFSRWEWNPEGVDSVVLAPGEESLFLSVKFTPPDIANYHAILEIHSDSSDNNPLLLLLCGQAAEVICSTSIDKTCPECASCTQDDFQDMINNPPAPPDCSDFD